MDNVASIIKAAVWIGKAIGSTRDTYSNFDTEQYGTKLPDTILTNSGVSSALTHISSSAEKVSDASLELETAGGTDDDAQIIASFVKYGISLVEYFVLIKDLVNAVDNAINAGTISNANERATAEAFVVHLAKALTDYTIIAVIESVYPPLMLILKMFGLAEWKYVPAAEANDLSRDHVIKKLQLEKIKDLFSDPEQHFKDTIGWGENGFDPSDFFQIYTEFFDEEVDIEAGEKTGDPFLRYGMFEISRDSTLNPSGLKFTLNINYTVAKTFRQELSEAWGLGIDTSATIDGETSVSIKPPLDFIFKPENTSADVTGEIKAYVDRNESARPFDIIGGGGLLNLSVNNTKFGVGMRADWDIVKNEASVDPLIFAEMSGLILRIGSSEADSFLANLLGDAEIEGQFDLGLEWSAKTGLRVKASGGIEIALPIHKDLGFIKFETIYIILKIKEDGSLELETSAAIVGLLGPLSASVDRIGALTTLGFAENPDSKYGMFNFDMGFKPPNGIGLSLDAGVIKGGGYVFLDFDKGEYAGVLELTFSGFISLKAIALITTKMPDGSDGFSLLVIITAEFGAGFQLGYGFKLIGVGGLLGLNRTMKLEPLAEGVRNGGINGIMFPVDPVANAQRIISDLKTYFPPEQGTFLIGPMAKIGWGTPTLISVSLGIIIEIPGNIAILGVIQIALPDEKTAILNLQVNFIGAIEFDKERLWFFASLYDSRVLFITIDGEMGLLIAWGNNADFVVSIGGFHPVFNPPALPFPSPVRLSFNILNESWGKVRIMGYFAVTSNTVQFGAGVELYFGFSAINIQGHIAFDALFQFSPFYFILSISASFSIKVFGIGLFSIRVKMSLEGPTPWRVKGTGSISLFFFDIDVDFNESWGDSQNTTLEPISVMPLMLAEMEKAENWTAELPPGNQVFVTLRQLDEEETDLVLHPVGTLKITQRNIPLDITLNKYGNQKPNDVNKFSLNVDGSDLVKESTVEEQFAIAQFQEMDSNEKLKRPSFENEHAGLTLSVENNTIATGKAIKRNIRYESIIIDSNYKTFVFHFFVVVGSIFRHFLRGNATAKSAASYATKKQLVPSNEVVSVKQDAYSVAYTSNNKAMNTEAQSFSSQALAQEYLNSQLASNAKLANQIQIIPQTELNSTL